MRSSDALRVQGKMGAEHRPGWVWSLGGMKRAVDDFQGFAKAERDEAEKRASDWSSFFADSYSGC